MSTDTLTSSQASVTLPPINSRYAGTHPQIKLIGFGFGMSHYNDNIYSIMKDSVLRVIRSVSSRKLTCKHINYFSPSIMGKDIIKVKLSLEVTESQARKKNITY